MMEELSDYSVENLTEAARKASERKASKLRQEEGRGRYHQTFPRREGDQPRTQAEVYDDYAKELALLAEYFKKELARVSPVTRISQIRINSQSRTQPRPRPEPSNPSPQS